MMILTIDGYDGTGKTTLAKNISNNYGFNYIEKPFIKKIEIENDLPYDDALIYSNELESKMYKEKDVDKLISFYCEAIYWLSKYFKNEDIILDRGILTTYAVFGTKENASLFKKYIDMGAFHDGSLYLKADDYERRRRIYERDPFDKDLKYPIKWRDNDLEDFAKENNLNYQVIITDSKTTDEVFEEAKGKIDLLKNSSDIKALKRVIK